MRKLIVAVLVVASLALAAAPAEAGTIRGTLSWTDNSSDESNFVVERKVGAGAFEVLATLPADTTTYQDNGLAMATSYCYRVLATNALGSSPPSAEACATTPTTPAAPSGLQLLITITP